MNDELLDGKELPWDALSGPKAPDVGESLPAPQRRNDEPFSVIQRFVEVFR